MSARGTYLGCNAAASSSLLKLVHQPSCEGERRKEGRKNVKGGRKGKEGREEKTSRNDGWMEEGNINDVCFGGTEPIAFQHISRV